MPRKPLKRHGVGASFKRLRNAVKALEYRESAGAKSARFKAAQRSLRARLEEAEKERQKLYAEFGRLLKERAKVLDLIERNPKEHMKIVRAKQPKAEKAGPATIQVVYPNSWLGKQVYRKPYTPLVRKKIELERRLNRVIQRHDRILPLIRKAEKYLGMQRVERGKKFLKKAQE